MGLRAILFWGAILVARAACAGNEVGGNGDRVSAWFAAIGGELVAEARRQESLGHALVPGTSADELQAALSIRLVLVDAGNRRRLENQWGEIKDLRVVRDAATGRALLLLDAETWTRLYQANRRDYRTVLHGYLYAAGRDDSDYRLSGAADLSRLESEVSPECARINVCRAEKKVWANGWRTAYAKELRFPALCRYAEPMLQLEPELGIALWLHPEERTARPSVILEVYSYKRTFVVASSRFATGARAAELTHRLSSEPPALLEITCRRE